MASILKVDALTGVTTAGSISVTGEGNSTTTNLQQGLLKFWMQANLSTMSYDDSFNASSATDTATGQMTSAFTNNFSNANYSITGASNSGDANVYNGAQATNQWRTYMRSEANADNDASFAGYMIAGDLA
jgi:hypothetical protein